MAVDSGRSVLVLDPPFGADARDACAEFLTGGAGPAAVLSVLYRESVADRMELLERHGGAVESAAIVRVGPVGGDDPYGDHSAVRRLGDPADLTGVGMALTDWLQARTDPQRAAICLDSLSTMLQYVDDERALQFLHTVTSQCRRRGVDVHCHLDPRAHDDRLVAQLRQLFDDQRRLATGPVAEAATDQRVATDGGAATDGGPTTEDGSGTDRRD